MKKKILSILITILAVCTFMLTMTACDGKVEFKINFFVDNENSFHYCQINESEEAWKKAPPLTIAECSQRPRATYDLPPPPSDDGLTPTFGGRQAAKFRESPALAGIGTRAFRVPC